MNFHIFIKIVTNFEIWKNKLNSEHFFFKMTFIQNSGTLESIVWFQMKILKWGEKDNNISTNS